MSTEFFNIHDNLKGMPLDKIKQLQKDSSLPYGVCVVNLLGNLNIGTIIRTACVMGAERVIVLGRRQYDARSCVGSNNYIEIIRDENGICDPEGNISIDAFALLLDSYNYMPILIEQTENSDNIDTISKIVSSNYKPCLIFGCESKGLPLNLIDAINYSFHIPQMGVIRSLNVSAAAAIAMWEMKKAILSMR